MGVSEGWAAVRSSGGGFRAVLAAGLAVGATSSWTSGHDEDWRKLVDRVPPVSGPIFRRSELGDAIGAGVAGSAPAGLFPSSGVTLRTHIPVTQFPGGHASGNDCWGYVSPSGREYAIMGLERGFGFVEVTDPDNAQLIATIAGPASIWHDVKVIGTFAYGVGEGGGGVQVMDLSQIDAGVVTLVGNVSTGGHSTTHNIVSNPESGRLYLAGANIGNGGLINLDLSNPAQPTVSGGWTSFYVHDAQVVTWRSGPLAGREIAFTGSGIGSGLVQGGLRVVDMTNPSSPQLLATLIYPNGDFTHQVWLSDDHRYLYINDEEDELLGRVGQTTTRIVDVSDPTSPQLVGTFSSGLGAIDHNLYVNGRYIYEANYTIGLRVFDAVDPLNPVEIAFFDTWPENNATTFNGAWSVYPFFPSGTVLISDFERGLFVVTVDAISAELLTIRAVGEVPTVVSPEGGGELTVRVTEQNTLLGSQGVELVVLTGGGEVVVPGTPRGDGTFGFVFPTVACGAPVSYYVRATAADGTAFFLPEAGAAAPFEATVASGSLVALADDFEADLGWTVTSTASDGQWGRGVPVNGGRGDPAADFDGSGSCFLTDNSAANGGNSDVDSGATTLTSPLLSVTGAATVRYAYWFNDFGSGTVAGSDALAVQYTLDNGLTWTEARRHTTAQAAWREDAFGLPDAASATGVRVRFIASDDNPQNVIEAGVDAFVVETLTCEDAGPSCAADVAAAFGSLDVNDVIEFVNAFNSGGALADVSPPGGDGSLNVNDIIEFVNSFNAGCP